MRFLLGLIFSCTTILLNAQSDSTSNMYDYGFRIYNSRMCGGCKEKYMNTKPITKLENPYKFSSINPINLDSLPDSTKTQILNLINRQTKDNPIP